MSASQKTRAASPVPPTELRVLVSPEAVTFGRTQIRYVDIARMHVMLQPAWRADPDRVAAWLVLDNAFRNQPDGPWLLHVSVLSVLAELFRGPELDLGRQPADWQTYFFACLHATNLALTRLPAPPPTEGEPAAAEPAPEATAESERATPASDDTGTGGAEKKAA